MSLSELRELVMDREAWHAVIHGVVKSQTRLSDWTELNWTASWHVWGFPGGSVVKNLLSMQELQENLVPAGSGRSPRWGHVNPLHYSFLENPMEREAWPAMSLVLQRVRHDWSDLAHTMHKWHLVIFLRASLVAQNVKNLPAKSRPGLHRWVETIPWRKSWLSTPVFLPGESPWTEEPGKLQFMGL